MSEHSVGSLRLLAADYGPWPEKTPEILAERLNP